MDTGHRAKKSLGQNFLVDPNQQRRIVQALSPAPDDVVVEIGPGHGALTRHLAGAVRRLVLIELDDDLARGLAAEYAGRDDVIVVHEDVMQVDVRTVAGTDGPLKIVGNIPYNITTPIIFRLLERSVGAACIVLMIQKEVAERIVAPAGTGEYGALSVGVRSVARVERLFNVGRGSFRPVPRVDSAVIRITPLQPPPMTPAEEADLRDLTRVLFSWRRKQLQKTLRSAPAYMLDAASLEEVERETGIRLAERPEQLDPQTMIRLARSLRRAGRPAPPGNTAPPGNAAP